LFDHLGRDDFACGGGIGFLNFYTAMADAWSMRVVRAVRGISSTTTYDEVGGFQCLLWIW
jgi:hypothetical protein